MYESPRQIVQQNGTTYYVALSDKRYRRRSHQSALTNVVFEPESPPNGLADKSAYATAAMPTFN